MSQVVSLKARQLQPGKEALRTEVDRKGLAFQELKTSLARDGFINSISGTPMTNDDGTPRTNEHGESMYEIGDGFHRWSACQDLGIDDIPVLVLTKSDRSMLATQIAANSIKIDTKKVQYAQALKQIMQNGAMTVQELATFVNKSKTWVEQQLSLTNLPASVQKLIDDGAISAVNAINLAKLPADSVEEFIPASTTDPVAIFQQKVESFVKEKRKAMLEGRQIDRSFKPQARLRKATELKEVLDKGDYGTILKGITDPVKAAHAILAWSLHLDEASVTEQKEMYDAEEAKKAAAKAKTAAEKEAKAAASIEAAKAATAAAK